MTTLTASQRSRLPDSDFAIPESRSYPIPDKAHARNALARVHTFGSKNEIIRVEHAVHNRFPSIGAHKMEKSK